jgi:hypothetical protein
MNTARIRVSNAELPGVYSTDLEPQKGEDHRREISLDDGSVLGIIVYVSKRGRGVTTYGWRPLENPRAPLTIQVDAIKCLKGFEELILTRKG